MANKITEKYFEESDFVIRADDIVKAVSAKTGFRPKKEIFRGRIYDPGKVGSLIYRGGWQGRRAVLKIQGLKPEIDEIDMIGLFNAQNKSARVRLPALYQGEKWNEDDGYGYLIMEYVDGRPIYEPPLAQSGEIGEFTALYADYKANCLNKPFFPPEPHERSSLVYTARRVSHWARIAESQGNFADEEVRAAERFFTIAGRHLPSIRMEFMHGHFTYNDIFKTGGGYVLMSNLFWSYRPEYYDAVFHLWAGLKSLRDPKIMIGDVLAYLDEWQAAYEKLPAVKKDGDFGRKFAVVLLERVIGALLVDIKNQAYEDDNRGRKRLLALFRELFARLAARLGNMNPPAA